MWSLGMNRGQQIWDRGTLHVFGQSGRYRGAFGEAARATVFGVLWRVVLSL